MTQKGADLTKSPSREWRLLKPPPRAKLAISALFGQIEPKKIYFSCKPSRMPIIAFWGLEMSKKGVSIAFFGRR